MHKVRVFLTIFCALMTANTVCAESDDLFLQKKSDASVKPLVFPLSLVVVENRPEKASYYFFENESARWDSPSSEESHSEVSKFQQTVSDAKVIRKTLVALDPARINPSEQGEDVTGPVTREVLKKIAKQYGKDLVLVFRREIGVLPDAPVAPSVFQNPDQLFDVEKAGHYSLRVRNLGLVYLAKQNKVLVIPANEKSKSIFTGGQNRAQEEVMVDMHQLSREGLQALAASAKKIIKDKQFVVRRPTY